MLEHASAMIGRKLAKKLKVLRMTDNYSCSIYHLFLLKISCVSIVPEISCFYLFLYLTW